MPSHVPSDPPPDPRDLTDFADLTTRLRELFAWCGSPKYASLSQTSGLAPSAISGLIGKRPSRRPAEAATLRFVEACLLRGGLAEDAVGTEVERWRDTWRRLDAAETDADAPRPALTPGTTRSPGAGTSGTSGTSGAPAPARTSVRRRRPVLVGATAALAVVVLAAVVVGVLGLVHGDGGGSGRASAGSPHAVCHRTAISEANDVRNAAVWSSAFRCPNKVGAAVRLQPAPGSPLVSRMKTPTSWFVCWTRGKEHAGGNSIWYYTQGDGIVPKYQRDHSWGFVAASDLGTEKDPDPRAFRRCPKDVPAL